MNLEPWEEDDMTLNPQNDHSAMALGFVLWVIIGCIIIGAYCSLQSCEVNPNIQSPKHQKNRICNQCHA